jgi:multidrug resistance efflux pump
MKWFLILSLAGTVAGAASWRYYDADTAKSHAAIAGYALNAGSEIQGIGYVEPISEVRRLMPRAGGVIKRCWVQVGQRVRQGELLVELEDATPCAEVEQARKQLEAARAEADSVLSGINPYQIKVAEQTASRLREKLRHCTVEARRTEAMRTTRAVSAQEYELAQSQRRQAEAELKEQEAELVHLREYVTPQTRTLQEAKVRQAHSNLTLAEERLREYRVYAPFDGVVLKLLKREGDAVWPSAPEAVVLFGDLARLRVRAEIDERYVQQLEMGQPAVVYGRNLAGRSYQGRIAVVEKLMGDKTLFARSSSERKDLQVLQVLLDMDPDFQAPVGLQVDVVLHPTGDTPTR